MFLLAGIHKWSIISPSLNLEDITRLHQELKKLELLNIIQYIFNCQFEMYLKVCRRNKLKTTNFKSKKTHFLVFETYPKVLLVIMNRN